MDRPDDLPRADAVPRVLRLCLECVVAFHIQQIRQRPAEEPAGFERPVEAGLIGERHCRFDVLRDRIASRSFDRLQGCVPGGDAVSVHDSGRLEAGGAQRVAHARIRPGHR